MLSKPLDRRIGEYNSIFYFLSYFTFVCWTLLSTLVVVVYLLFFNLFDTALPVFTCSSCSYLVVGSESSGDRVAPFVPFGQTPGLFFPHPIK